MSVRLTVHTTPRSSRSEISGMRGDALSVRVTAPPEDGKANKALVALIADALHVPKSAVRVVQGTSSRTKVVEVDGIGRNRLDRLFESVGRDRGNRDE